MKSLCNLLLLLTFFSSCRKMKDDIIDKGTITAFTEKFNQYTIRKGQQFCEQTSYRPVDISEMKFIVRFDSTAIYQSAMAENQFDINKLYGFADNGKDHHQYSARFGWRWSNKALRLFAYVYNDGLVTSKELSTVAIGASVNCSIRVVDSLYIFTVDNITDQIPRHSTTKTGKGYQLFPYFGGDEVAPHDINIFIRD